MLSGWYGTGHDSILSHPLPDRQSPRAFHGCALTRKAAAGSGQVLGRRALNRAFMARQSMISRSAMGIADAIEHLVGLQGQVPLVPYTSLWSRLDAFDPDELGRLVTERAVVRTSLMRGTIHMVTASDALFLRPLLQPVLERVLRQSSPFGRAVAGVDEVALFAAGRELVEARPLTRAALSARLAERFPGYDPLSLAYMTAGLIPMVQVPPRGVWGAKSIQATWTTMSAWLGTPVGPAAPDALETMVLRYLAAFGPATVMDVQSWCWLTKLGAVMERLRPRLRTFRDEQGRELFDVPDGPRPDPETPIPPRFLGEYDNLFLSHADRSRIGAIDLAERNFRKGPFFVDRVRAWLLGPDPGWRPRDPDRGAVPAARRGRSAGHRRGGRAAACIPGAGRAVARRAVRGGVRVAARPPAVSPGLAAARSGAGVPECRADQGLRLLDESREVVVAAEALRVDLVDVLRPRRPRREPALLGRDLQPADRRTVARARW